MELLFNTLTSEGVKYEFTESKSFKAINVRGGKSVLLAKSILYVLGYTVNFVQPLGAKKFEILFN